MISALFFFWDARPPAKPAATPTMESTRLRPRPAATVFGAFPPDVWLHIKAMLGGRACWREKYRRAVLPCIPRSEYRFSFVGIFRKGPTVYIVRYNECVLRARLRRRAGRRGRGRPVRGRRPQMKVYEYEMCDIRSTGNV